jgi:hypothetical protein
MMFKLAHPMLPRFVLACTVALSLGIAGCNKKSSSDDDDNDDNDDNNDDTEEPRASKKKKSSSDDKSIMGDKDKKKVVAGTTFTGTWQTPWGKVTLVHAGSKVSGAYSGKFTGSLDGQATDGVVTLTWIQTNGERGKARLTLAKDGRSFTGTWGSRTSSTNGGAWNGKRLN